MTIPAPRFFRRSQASPNGGWSALDGRRTRDWESSYRERWQHDRIVRSTHGVNCTGSCSWKVHVKEGIVTWETQQTDYPENGADVPDYEPRGCPRGASFSWYVYSPLRIRYPYVRGALLERYREALAAHRRSGRRLGGDRRRPGRPRGLHLAARQGRLRARLLGRGRPTWSPPPTSTRSSRWGPDRVVGFSPIPAMSMASYAAGTRFFSLIGGVLTSFYDWYADLPPASPQVWGDQTDVPESADWWNADLPDDVGLQHPHDAHARRALHDRGALPGPEDRRGLARLLGPHQVRRPLARRASRAPTARSRWRWPT